jgi:hypothetical protein
MKKTTREYSISQSDKMILETRYCGIRQKARIMPFICGSSEHRMDCGILEETLIKSLGKSDQL